MPTLYSTISPSVLPYTLELNTYAEILDTIDKRLLSMNRAHLQQIKNELHNLSMGNRMMAQYLTKIKSKVDLLTIGGLHTNTKDIIYYTLNGLPSMYQSFKVSLDDLYSLLCSEETLLQSEATQMESPNI